MAYKASGFFNSFATSFLNNLAANMAESSHAQELADAEKQKQLESLNVQEQLYDYQKTRDLQTLNNKASAAESAYKAINQTPDAITSAPAPVNPALAPVPVGVATSTDDNAQPFPASSPIDDTSVATPAPTSSTTPPVTGGVPPAVGDVSANSTPAPAVLPAIAPATSPTQPAAPVPIAAITTGPVYSVSTDPVAQKEAHDAYVAAYTKEGGTPQSAQLAADAVLTSYTKASPQYKATQDMNERQAKYNLAVANGADPDAAKEQFLGKAFGNSEKAFPGGDEGAARAAEYNVPYSPDKAFERLSSEQQWKTYQADKDALSKKNDKAYSAASATAANAQKLLGLNDEVSTGGIYALPGTNAFRTAFDTNTAEFQKIATDMSLKVRPDNFTRVTNFDLQQFQKALPSLSIPNEANYTIAAGILAQAERDKQYYEFQQSWVSANGHYDASKANAAWGKYVDANPIFDPTVKGAPVINTKAKSWEDYFATSPDNPNAKSAPAGTTTPVVPAPPKVGDTQGGYKFTGGDPSSQSSWEKVKQ